MQYCKGRHYKQPHRDNVICLIMKIANSKVYYKRFDIEHNTVKDRQAELHIFENLYTVSLTDAEAKALKLLCL